MLKFSLVLFLNILLLISRYQEVYTVNYLPLTLIQRKNDIDFADPNELKKITFEANRGFTGDTRFAWNEYEKQIFFCPVNSRVKDYITRLDAKFLSNLSDYYNNGAVARHCMFEKTYKPNDILTCTEEPTPSIYKAQVGWYLNETGVIDVTNRDTKCGPDNKGVLFKFAYDLCFPKTWLNQLKYLFNSTRKDEKDVFSEEIPFLYMTQTVYEICFNMEDREREETFYTKHELSTIKLLKDPHLEYERDREKENNEISDEAFGQNFQFKNYIEFLNNLPKPYKKQKLVPPGDRMTALLRKPTFHYINIKPMHEKVIELWHSIENYLQEYLPETEIPYQIYTGAFKISDESKKSKIPDFWIKVIYLPNKQIVELSQSLAIVVRNEYKNNEEYDNLVMESFCRQDDCQFLKKDKTLEKFLSLSQQIRCCAVGSKISDLFNIAFNLNVPLLLV